MIRRPPRATRTDTLFPYTTLFRSHAVTSAEPASLSVARGKLAQAVVAYRKGDRAAAKELPFSAYLDGFEPVQPLLTARDGTLTRSEARRVGKESVSTCRSLRSALPYTTKITYDAINQQITILP